MDKMIIVVAPSGAGKNTFIEKLLESSSVEIRDVVTYTTREMRKGESQGNPYYFISKDDFEEKNSKGFFVESARVHSNLYGTSFDEVKKHWDQGHPVIMDIDIQGADVLKTKFPSSRTFFIQPPSLEVLKERLLQRGGGSLPEDFDVRMESAKREMAWAPRADEIVINDNFDRAFEEFRLKVENYLKND